jgi:hypothetical protein
MKRAIWMFAILAVPLCSLQAATGERVTIEFGEQSTCSAPQKGLRYYTKIVRWTNLGRTRNDYTLWNKLCAVPGVIGCETTSCVVTLSECRTSAKAGTPNEVRVAIKGISPASAVYTPSCGG